MSLVVPNIAIAGISPFFNRKSHRLRGPHFPASGLLVSNPKVRDPLGWTM